MNLYDRQEQLNLKQYNVVVVVGVGGIGSWVALNLALSGVVSKLVLIDDDIIEESNLNRTPFKLSDIGYYKVDALQYLILERRIMDVTAFNERTNPVLISDLKELFKPFLADSNIIGTEELINSICIVDCRDDAISDLYCLNVKYYKIGYDGRSITIDGNPRNTSVWGEANTYTVTPSFVCPSQLAANLVVADMLMIKDEYVNIDNYEDTITNNSQLDTLGRFNSKITFDSLDIIETMKKADS